MSSTAGSPGCCSGLLPTTAPPGAWPAAGERRAPLGDAAPGWLCCFPFCGVCCGAVGRAAARSLAGVGAVAESISSSRSTSLHDICFNIYIYRYIFKSRHERAIFEFGVGGDGKASRRGGGGVLSRSSKCRRRLIGFSGIFTYVRIRCHERLRSFLGRRNIQGSIGSERRQTGKPHVTNSKKTNQN